jgi:hypothetical protein
MKSSIILVHLEMPTVAMGLYPLHKYLVERKIRAHLHRYDSLEGLLNEVQKRKASIVGFSVQWHPQLVPSIKIAEAIKVQDRSICIVLGGITASFFRRELIHFNCVDFIIKGDGEEPLAQLCHGNPPSTIPNLIWKEESGAVVENDASYSIGRSNLTSFRYETQKDFLSTRGVLRIGKGCPAQCPYCGGSRHAFHAWDGTREVCLDSGDIRDLLVANYSKIKFEEIYISQDILNNFQHVLDGLMDVPDGIASRIGITIAPWRNIPTARAIDALCAKFRTVTLELSIESINRSVSTAIHRKKLDKKKLLKILPRYLRNANLWMDIFFSYPHFAGDRLIFPDPDTVEFCQYLHEALHQYVMERRLGIEYLPLSTDPGSLYYKGISFKEYWEALSQTKNEVGSFTLHHRRLYRDNDYIARHLFMQSYIYLCKTMPFMMAYLWKTSGIRSFKKYLKDWYSVFSSIHETCIRHQLSLITPHADGYSLFGYSCLNQENLGQGRKSEYSRELFTQYLLQKRNLPCEFHNHSKLLQDTSRYGRLAYRDILKTDSRKMRAPKELLYPMRNLLHSLEEDSSDYFSSIKMSLMADNVSRRSRKTILFHLMLNEAGLPDIVRTVNDTDLKILPAAKRRRLKTLLGNDFHRMEQLDRRNKNRWFYTVFDLVRIYQPVQYRYYEALMILVSVFSNNARLRSAYDSTQNGKFNTLGWKPRNKHLLYCYPNNRILTISDVEVDLLHLSNGLRSYDDIVRDLRGKYPWLLKGYLGMLVEFYYRRSLIV